MKTRTPILKALIYGIVAVIVYCLIAAGIGNFIRSMSPQSIESNLVYDSLDYKVQVLKNGDMTMTQTIAVNMSDRKRPWRQLFQEYNLSSANLTNISDISVTNLTTGEQYSRKNFSFVDTEKVSIDQWNTVAARSWYLVDPVTKQDITQADTLRVSQHNEKAKTRGVELGWNIPPTRSGVQTFRITMTFKDVATALQDGVYTMWEPISRWNVIPIKHLTGTITYPDKTTASWMLMHYTGKGKTHKVDNKTFTFSADNVQRSRYVDFVILYRSSDVQSVQQISRKNTDRSVKTVLDDEKNQAEQWALKQRTAARNRLTILIVCMLPVIVMIIWLVAGAVHTKKRAKYRGDIEYFRDLPAISPAATARLYGVMEQGKSTSAHIQQRALSATMLSLVSKHALFILPGSARGYENVSFDYATAAQIDSMIQSAMRGTSTTQVSEDQISSIRQAVSDAAAQRSADMTYILSLDSFENDFAEKHHLSQSEKKLLAVLHEVSDKKNTLVLSNDDIKEIAGTRGSVCASLIKLMYAKFDAEYDALRVESGTAVYRAIPRTLSFLLIIALTIYGLTTPYFAAYLIASALWVFFLFFTDVGGAHVILKDPYARSAGEVWGLARYLNDFSDFSDRGIADMHLWDRYLVYAAAFGMSSKVAKSMRTLAMQQSATEEDMNMLPYTSTSWMYMPWHHSFYASSASSAVTSSPSTNTAMWSDGLADFSSFDAFTESFNSSLSAIQDDFATAIKPVENYSSSDGSSGNSGWSSESFGGSSGWSSGSFGGSFGGSGGGSFGGR